jgi:hypothetical protein
MDDDDKHAAKWMHLQIPGQTCIGGITTKELRRGKFFPELCRSALKLFSQNLMLARFYRNEG